MKCAPLTRQQIDALLQLENETVAISVTGYVLSHRFKAEELSGVVCVKIDIVSSAGTCRYQFSDVRFRISVRHVGRPGVSSTWAVHSVELVES